MQCTSGDYHLDWFAKRLRSLLYLGIFFYLTILEARGTRRSSFEILPTVPKNEEMIE
ncbi:hypothetical protein SNOG_08738 [Parastagonospora nodorum SN15]|uniref:Uncharacterized protein n=1 Tax=Phaeosphaeria nodorum (strain SN15 / ATCC MYA-4574 / FGSC 10173) TaxID=321614 RepID=Q0UHM6_PHANO|nr:hypothetical protein SNOG_08738 [Parastagonospora nodorum SN15]EAT83906.1 hypothetical protein SNOG_08738 [Parastagonospora nodorum SN15]